MRSDNLHICCIWTLLFRNTVIKLSAALQFLVTTPKDDFEFKFMREHIENKKQLVVKRTIDRWLKVVGGTGKNRETSVAKEFYNDNRY